MLGLTDIKTGKKIILGGEPYAVLDYQHSKIGRGGAVLRTKLKNLITGGTVEHTFQGADKVEEAEIIKKDAQYLYQEGENFLFMDMGTYDQFPFSKDAIGDAAHYLLEGTEVKVLEFNGQPINVELPVKVTLTVSDAPPGLKGDTASGGDKVVTTETGLQITTPLFIKQGDRIVINTETGMYVSRA